MPETMETEAQAVTLQGTITRTREETASDRETLEVQGRLALGAPKAKGGSAGVPWLEILGKVTAFASLAGAWLLLVGWAYAYFYFEKFGIGLTALALRIDELPLYGFLTLRSYWGLVLAVLFVGGLIAWWARGRVSRLPSGLIALLITVGLFGLFAGGCVLGKANAQRVHKQMVAEDYPGYRRIQVWTKGPWLKDARLQATAAALAEPSACYRLILATAKALYLFRPLKGHTALEPPVLVIPLGKGELHAYRLLAREDSCAL